MRLRPAAALLHHAALVSPRLPAPLPPSHRRSQSAPLRSPFLVAIDTPPLYPRPPLETDSPARADNSGQAPASPPRSRSALSVRDGSPLTRSHNIRRADKL